MGSEPMLQEQMETAPNDVNRIAEMALCLYLNMICSITYFFGTNYIVIYPFLRSHLVCGHFDVISWTRDGILI